MKNAITLCRTWWLSPSDAMSVNSGDGHHIRDTAVQAHRPAWQSVVGRNGCRDSAGLLLSAGHCSGNRGMDRVTVLGEVPPRG